MLVLFVVLRFVELGFNLRCYQCLFMFVVMRFEVVGLIQVVSIWQLGYGGIAFDQCLAGRPAVVYVSELVFRLLI